MELVDRDRVECRALQVHQGTAGRVGVEYPGRRRPPDRGPPRNKQPEDGQNDDYTGRAQPEHRCDQPADRRRRYRSHRFLLPHSRLATPQTERTPQPVYPRE